MLEDLVNYFMACSIVLVFTIACLVSFRRRGGDSTARIFLSLMFWVYVYALVCVFIFDNVWMKYVPHLFRTVQVASLIYPPLSYLYVRQTLRPGPLKFRDLLHLIPAIVFILDYSAFFLLPAEEKVRIYNVLREGRLFFRLEEGLFMPAGGHILMRYLVMVGYWIAQAGLVFRLAKFPSQNMPKDQRNLVQWLKWLTASQLILMLPPLLNFTFDFFPVGLINGICSMIAVIVQAYFLFFHPTILYGFFGQAPETSSFGRKGTTTRNPSDSGVPDSKDGGEKVREAWMEGLAAKLEHYFEDQRPFLRKGYCLPDLARELDCTTNQLSYLVNNHYGVNFNRLVNRYRVEACKEKLINREFEHKTLEALANESGFTSRATFINAFKSETGATPTEFVRELKANPV